MAMKPVEIEFLMKNDTKTGFAEIMASSASTDQKLAMTQAVIARLREELGRLQTQMQSNPTIDNSANIAQVEQFITVLEGLEAQIKEAGNTATSVASKVQTTPMTPTDIPKATQSFNGLNMSIQQIAREMPSLAMGPQMFFMAISNNLPIFADAVSRARLEYEALTKAGQKATPVWKQIATSLFSWQTALTTGIMLLVMYGDEIVDWVSSLIKGEEQLTATERAQRGLSEAIKESGYGIGDKIVLLRQLSDEWITLADDLDAKKKFIKENQSAFEDLGVAISDVNSAENLMVDYTDEFIEALRLRAEATAANKLAAEKYEEALIAESEAEKLTQQRAGVEQFGYTEVKKWVDYDGREHTTGGHRYERKEYTDLTESISAHTAVADAARAEADAYYDIETALKKKAAALLETAGIEEDDNDNKETSAEYAKRERERRLQEERRMARELRQLRWDNEQSEIAQMEDGTDKRIRQIKLDYEKTTAAIRDQETEWRDAQNGAVTPEQSSALASAYANAQQDMQNAIAAVNEEEVQKGREKLNALLEEYRTYDQQRRDIDAAYQADLAILNEEKDRLSKAGEDTSNIEASIQARTDAYREDIQALQSEILQSTEFYDKLFSNVSQRGYAALKDFYERAKETLENAQMGTDGVTIEVPVKQADGTFVKKAVKVTVAEFERMKQQVLAIQKELEKKNPFAAFKTSWTELMTAMKSGGDVTGGLSNLNAKGKELTSTIKGWGDSLGAVFGEGFSQSINEMMTMVDGVMDMGTGIAQIFSGDIVGGITSTLSGLAAIIEMFASWKEKNEALKREMYFAEIETNRAIRERNQELAVERDTIQDIITKQELLNWLVEKGFSKPSSVSVWEAQSAALAEYQKNLEAEMSQYDELWEKLQSSNAYWEWRESLSWGSVEHSLRGMSAAEIELYYNQNKLSDAAREYYEAWVESGKTIEELKQHIEETYASLQEMVMGTSFDGFLSNVINAMREARGEISKLASFAEETLAEALINAFKYQHLAKVLEPLYNSLSEALIDDTADAAFIEEWKNLFISVLGNETEKLKALGDALGIDLFESSGTSQNGKSGGFETMTQDQGTKLEGLFTSGQMHWSSIDSKMDNVTNALGDSLDVLEDIKENTDCIPSILDELRKWIRDGIKVK
ncbi:MAG: hypothetical protein IKB90_01525 [Alistipes sp.]|nr:hypothetical protein [Alistipes sp.]MBR3590484.1 hypothetical protein [Alistipes sp.]